MQWMRGDMDFDDTWLAFSLLDSKAGANWVTTKRFESQWLNLVKVVNVEQMARVEQLGIGQENYIN